MFSAADAAGFNLPPSFLMPWKVQVFRIYVVILILVLAVAGIVLTFFSRVLLKDVRSIWVTYRSWLVMTSLLLGTVMLGRIPIILLMAILAGFGFKEFARATGLYRDWWMTGAVYLAIAAAAIIAIIPDPNNGKPGWYGLFMTLPAYAVALFIAIPIVRNRPHGQLQAMALAIVGFLYIGWMFMHLALLADRANAYGYLFYLVFAVELSDVAAFTFGHLLGQSAKHPFRSGISPKKSWEGAVGAFVVSMVLPWLLRFSFPQFGPIQLILTGLIVGIGGQLGDLAVSVIKRDVGIKDMGGLIPGHGGILDRIDSLIYTAPLFMHMVDYFYKQW
jgi:phosphatidate cytidylyltransferase